MKAFGLPNQPQSVNQQSSQSLVNQRASSIETTGTSGVNIGFVLVEIADSSASKLPVTASTTPLALMRIVGKKNSLETIHFFGIQASRSSMITANTSMRSPEASTPNVPTSPLQQSTVPGSPSFEQTQFEERVFLVDDLPLQEQILISPKTRLYMAMKYSFTETDIESEMPKTMTLIYQELAVRFKTFQDILPRPALISMVACIVHCNTQQRIGGESLIEDVKAVIPVGCTSFLQEDTFYEQTRDAIKQIVGSPVEVAILKFLKLFWANCPAAFQHRFDLIHPEFSIPTAVYVSSHGITFKCDQQAQQSPQQQGSGGTQLNYSANNTASTFIPFRRMKNWQISLLDGDSVVFKHGKLDASTTAEHRLSLKILGSETAASSNGSMPAIDFRDSVASQSLLSGEKEELFKNILNLSSSSLATNGSGFFDKPSTPSSSSLIGSTPILEGWMKRANTIRRNNNSKRPALPTKERLYRYIFSIELQEEYLNDVELAMLSIYPNDYQMIEIMNHYYNRVIEAEKATKKPDSSNFPPGSQVALAKVDYVAKTRDELMFLAGDEILVLKKLEHGKFLGECQGVQGVFDGSKVTMLLSKRDTGNSSEANLKNTNSTSAFQSIHIGANINSIGPGFVLNIHLMDDTKRSVIISPHTNGAGLRKQAIEKLELFDGDFFDIVDITNGEHRWIRPDIMLISQGITSCSKLLLKARVLYYDVAELSSPISVYLYYLQIKQMILSGDFAGLTETDVIDLASLQLQATFGDYDQDTQKGSFLQNASALQQYLPPQFNKMTLSKNESFWSKRIYAAYQQHKGLTKRDAEKAYIASAQRFPVFGYQLHNVINPDNLLIGIGRDGFIVLDKITKNVTEKHTISDIMYSSRNSGFTAQLYFEEDSNEMVTRVFTLASLDIIETFRLLSVAESKSKQRRRCRFIREKFNTLNLNLETANEPQELKFLKDPERLSSALKNGYALSLFLEALKQPMLTNIELEPLVVTEELLFKDSSEGSRVKSIKNFLAVCAKDYEMAASDLFRPEDVWPYNLSSFHRVTEFLFQLLNLPKVAANIQQIADILKKKKRSRKAASFLENGGSSTGEMTEDDFLRKILQELLATEKSYVSDLEKIVERFVMPLKTRAATGDPNDLLVLEMFGNVEDLMKFHQEFLNVLDVFGCDIERIGDIGLLFSEKGDEFIPLYDQYCLNHLEPSERLPAELRISQETMSIIGFVGDPQADQMAKHQLSAQIIKPVQRIMRYHLLLKELLKYAAKDDTGYGNLEAGLNKMKEVASKINEIKRAKENSALAKSLGETLESYEGPPIEMLGQLLVHGRLQMVEKGLPSGASKKALATKNSSVNVFLFEEIVLCCVEGKKKSGSSPNPYKVKQMLIPAHVDVREEITDSSLVEDVKSSWEVSRKDGQKSLIFTASSPEEKERWVNALLERCALASSGKRSIVLEFLESNAFLQRKGEEYSGLKLPAFGSIRKAPKSNSSNPSTVGGADLDANAQSRSGNSTVSRSQSNGQLYNNPQNGANNAKTASEAAVLNLQISQLMQTIEQLQKNIRILNAENTQLAQRLKIEQDKTKHLEKELAKNNPPPPNSVTVSTPSPSGFSTKSAPVIVPRPSSAVGRSAVDPSLRAAPAVPPKNAAPTPPPKRKDSPAHAQDQLALQMSELQSLLLNLSSNSLNEEGGLRK